MVLYVILSLGHVKLVQACAESLGPSLRKTTASQECWPFGAVLTCKAQLRWVRAIMLLGLWR